MTRQTIYGVWVNDDGNLNDNEKAVLYVVDCAKSVGMEVIPYKTSLDFTFIAEVMKRMREGRELTEEEVNNLLLDLQKGDEE